MKLIFNDATELTIQSADIQAGGNLLIRTISETPEKLKMLSGYDKDTENDC